MPASKHGPQTMVVVESRLYSSQSVSLWFSFRAEAAARAGLLKQLLLRRANTGAGLCKAENYLSPKMLSSP